MTGSTEQYTVHQCYDCGIGLTNQNPDRVACNNCGSRDWVKMTDGTERKHQPVDVPADDDKNYRQIKKCEGCGAPGARVARFCLDCFRHELERGAVDPSDPRVENHGFGGENYA